MNNEQGPESAPPLDEALEALETAASNALSRLSDAAVMHEAEQIIDNELKGEQNG